LRDILHTIGDGCHNHSPQTIVQIVSRFIRNETGQDDPWRHPKHTDVMSAMALLPEFRRWIERVRDPFTAAAALAIAANGLVVEDGDAMGHTEVRQVARDALRVRRSSAMKHLKHDVANAKRIVYLADKAGEIAFDRLFIEQILPEKVTYVVKGRPVGQLATIADAATAGMCSLVDVIDDGTDIPGTVLGECSRDLRDRLKNADLVIAKGQSHYATLGRISQPIFFMLRASCTVIADSLECMAGTSVLRSSNRCPCPDGADPRSQTGVVGVSE